MATPGGKAPDGMGKLLGGGFGWPGGVPGGVPGGLVGGTTGGVVGGVVGGVEGGVVLEGGVGGVEVTKGGVEVGVGLGGVVVEGGVLVEGGGGGGVGPGPPPGGLDGGVVVGVGVDVGVVVGVKTTVELSNQRAKSRIYCELCIWPTTGDPTITFAWYPVELESPSVAPASIWEPIKLVLVAAHTAGQTLSTTSTTPKINKKFPWIERDFFDEFFLK